MSIILAVLDILSVIVYLDLWLVNKFGVHVFTPLMKYVNKDLLKKYQVLYYNSLQRPYYCVSDKVDVSGTTFTVVFSIIYLASAIMNLSKSVIEWQYLHFYIIGVPYLIYLLFSMHTYRSTMELCFYCKFTLVHNPIMLVLMILLGTVEKVPRMYMWTFTIVIIGSLCVRGFLRKVKSKENAKKHDVKPRKQLLDNEDGVEDKGE